MSFLCWFSMKTSMGMSLKADRLLVYVVFSGQPVRCQETLQDPWGQSNSLLDSIQVIDVAESNKVSGNFTVSK